MKFNDGEILVLHAISDEIHSMICDYKLGKKQKAIERLNSLLKEFSDDEQLFGILDDLDNRFFNVVTRRKLEAEY